MVSCGINIAILAPWTYDHEAWFEMVIVLRGRLVKDKGRYIKVMETTLDESRKEWRKGLCT